PAATPSNRHLSERGALTSEPGALISEPGASATVDADPSMTLRALILLAWALCSATTPPTATMLAKIAPRPLVNHKAMAISRAQAPSSQILAKDRGSRSEDREWRIDGLNAFFDPSFSSLFNP